MVTIDPIIIANRRQEIADEIKRLQTEDAELEIAARVLMRLSADRNQTKQEVAEKLLDEITGRVPRPSGTPTTFEMLEFVLSGAEREGKNGLTATEIVDEIRRRYWPGLIGQQILPHLYRFAKAGRVRKTSGGKFKRIRDNSGMSESDEGQNESSARTPAH